MKKYMTIDDLVNCDKYPFTKGQIRNFIQKRKLNGLLTSILKIGRRVYIDEELFEKWIKSHTNTNDTINGDNALFNTSIEDLEISNRTYNVLKANDILTLKDVIQLTELDLSRLKGMGKKSIDEVIEILARFNLTLKSIF